MFLSDDNTRNRERFCTGQTLAVRLFVIIVLQRLIDSTMSSVADPGPFDTDPDPVFHFDTDSDPAFQSDTDPDPTV
jgi:hypothetical protein